MKYSSLLLAGLLFSSQSFASSIDGTWAFPEMNVAGVSLRAFMTVNDNSVTLSNTCSNGAASVLVTVTVPAQITATQIIALGSAHKNVNENGLQCNASIEQAPMDYNLISPRSLNLSAQGQSITVMKVD